MPKTLKRFVIGYVLLHVIATLPFVWVIARAAKNQMMENAKEKMPAMALVLREHVNQLDEGLANPGLVDHVKQIGEDTGFRFTRVTDRLVCLKDFFELTKLVRATRAGQVQDNQS